MKPQFKVHHFIIFCILFGPGFSHALKEKDISFARSLLDKKDFYQMGDFQGVNQARLAYARFGRQKGSKGSLIFLNGRIDNILLYIELFYDLYQKGWSPIYTYDHRGQGFSQRFVQNSAGHVEDYSHYTKDFEIFLSLILKDPNIDQNNLSAISHSLGSSVLVDYLQNKPQQKILKAVVLDSPLFRIQTGLNSKIESLILKLIKIKCLIKCNQPFPFTSVKKNENKAYLTSSLPRHRMAMLIEKRFPQVYLGGPSYRWVLEIYKMTDELMNQKRIQKIKTPILILQEEKDKLVSAEHQNRFCALIPRYCQIHRLKGEHKTFLETDSVRDKAIELMNQFLSSYSH